MKMTRNVIAILIGSFLSYQFYLGGTLLPAFYAAFPDMSQSVVILLFTAPNLLSSIACMVIGPVIAKGNKKMIMAVGLALIVICGVLILATGGSIFALDLFATCISGLGYALVISVSSAMLMEEVEPQYAAKAMGMNSAIGCAGSMILSYGGGLLAANGSWTRAYLLCLPSAVTLLLFMMMYQNHAPAAAESGSGTEGAGASSAAAAAVEKNVGAMLAVCLIFLLVVFGQGGWNTNSAVYIVENGIGTTAEVGIVNSLASASGVIVGIFFTGKIVATLKKWTVPVCTVILMIPGIAAMLHLSNIYVWYVIAFLLMFGFGPIYAVCTASCGAHWPGGVGVSVANGVTGLGNFVAPYVLTALAAIGGGTTVAKFTAAVGILIVTCIISVPVMKKVQA